MIDPLHAAWQRLIKRGRVTPIPIHQHLIIVPRFHSNGTVQCVYPPTSTPVPTFIPTPPQPHIPIAHLHSYPHPHPHPRPLQHPHTAPTPKPLHGPHFDLLFNAERLHRPKGAVDGMMPFCYAMFSFLFEKSDNLRAKGMSGHGVAGTL